MLETINICTSKLNLVVSQIEFQTIANRQLAKSQWMQVNRKKNTEMFLQKISNFEEKEMPLKLLKILELFFGTF